MKNSLPGKQAFIILLVYLKGSISADHANGLYYGLLF